MKRYREYWPSEEREQILNADEVDALIPKFESMGAPTDYLLYAIDNEKRVELTFASYPPFELQEAFMLQPYHLMDEFYELEYINGQMLFKVYDLSLVNHPIPQLPSGTRIVSMIVVYDEKGITPIRELEFFSDGRLSRFVYNVDDMNIISRSFYELEENEL